MSVTTVVVGAVLIATVVIALVAVAATLVARRRRQETPETRCRRALLNLALDQERRAWAAAASIGVITAGSEFGCGGGCGGGGCGGCGG